MKALRISMWTVSILTLAVALGAFIGAVDAGAEHGAAYGLITLVMLGVLIVLEKDRVEDEG